MYNIALAKHELSELSHYMEQNSVPTISSIYELNNIEKVKEFINENKFPVIIKAASGGGGKGMRIALNNDELEKSINAAKIESKKLFNDDTVYIEKFINNPKHIEIQILADQYGNTLTLGERDCSIQRNHQKLIMS